VKLRCRAAIGFGWLAVGVVGSNGGTMPTRAIVEMADLVVFVGCRAGSTRYFAAR